MQGLFFCFACLRNILPLFLCQKLKKKQFFFKKYSATQKDFVVAL